MEGGRAQRHLTPSKNLLYTYAYWRLPVALRVVKIEIRLERTATVPPVLTVLQHIRLTGDLPKNNHVEFAIGLRI